MPKIKVGDRIKLIHMPDDPDPIPSGSLGTVTHVITGKLAQIQVNWDNGRTLALVPGVYKFEVISRPKQPFREFAGCPHCGNWQFDTLVRAINGDVISCDNCGWKRGNRS